MEALTEIRNQLYDVIPSGQIDAFELIKIISTHLKKLDKYIDKGQKESISFGEFLLKSCSVVPDENHSDDLVWEIADPRFDRQYSTTEMHQIFKLTLKQELA